MKRAPLGAIAACAVASCALTLPAASPGRRADPRRRASDPRRPAAPGLRLANGDRVAVRSTRGSRRASRRDGALERIRNAAVSRAAWRLPGIRHRRWLADAAAREWLSANRALFELGSPGSLKLDHAARLPSSNAYAVIYRQEFGALEGADNVVTVGVNGSAASGWKVGYVSSTLARETGVVGEATLSAEQAWLEAAQHRQRSGLDPCNRSCR
jgi:hypothetical protein